MCAVFLTLVRDNLFVKSPGPIAFKLPILSKDSQIQNQAKFFLQTTVRSIENLFLFRTQCRRPFYHLPFMTYENVKKASDLHEFVLK